MLDDIIKISTTFNCMPMVYNTFLVVGFSFVLCALYRLVQDEEEEEQSLSNDDLSLPSSA